ncbi:hypothetical protein [Nocardiopsis halotolerans]|uniref:hypothetical protein n=1 Tax=Nocardiopsis halotolerans TaxID=124252 RepID=UPI000592F207|nr:hypothetical protein [Nocardiopsis halotolerans]
MRHPPLFARALSLLGLLAAVLWSPAAAHASSGSGVSSPAAGAFYAEMLEEHDGVFVQEELAGILDRRETADELRALLDEHHFDVDVLVVAGRDDHLAAYDMAKAVHEHGDRPLLVLPVDSLYIGHADLRAAGIPVSAVEYAGLTGRWVELPQDTLERLLRMADHPDVDALAEQAWTELPARSDVVSTQEVGPEVRATLTWRESGWVPWAGGALGAALTYVLVATALRWYWHWRPARKRGLA